MINYKKFAISVCLFFSPYCLASELVIATTLSTDATAYVIAQWSETNKEIKIQTLNRTSTSIERLVNSPFHSKIDLILSSSPMLMEHLYEQNKLLSLETTVPNDILKFVPTQLQGTVIPFALSGFGILSNKAYLQKNHLPVPTSWEDLTNKSYQGLILMSSPSRSDTNHLMVESVLQKYGWDEGWRLLLKMGGNLTTISSRSFSVVDKIKTELGAVGLTIDNYAHLLSDDALVFHYLPTNIPSPTFIAISSNSQNQQEAQQFIDFLLSSEGQHIISDPESGKYPIYQLPSDSPLFVQQQLLLQGDELDYNLVMGRQALVKSLFDTAITFRLNQLKESWKLLYDKEKQQNHSLPHIATLLTTVPITAEQANDPAFYTSLNNSPENNRMLISQWQSFFQMQNHKAIEELEHLK